MPLLSPLQSSVLTEVLNICRPSFLSLNLPVVPSTAGMTWTRVEAAILPKAENAAPCATTELQAQFLQKHCTSLRFLWFSHLEEDDAMWKAISSCQNLEELRIEELHAMPDWWTTLLENLKLKRLSIGTLTSEIAQSLPALQVERVLVKNARQENIEVLVKNPNLANVAKTLAFRSFQCDDMTLLLFVKALRSGLCTALELSGALQISEGGLTLALMCTRHEITVLTSAEEDILVKTRSLRSVACDMLSLHPAAA